MPDVTFFGESFRLEPADDYQVAMLDFAEAATGDLGDNTLEQLAVVKKFLRAIFSPDDFKRFWALATKNKAQVTRDLMPVVVAAFQQETGRPTGRASDSSDGPASEPENSADASSSPIMQEVARLERMGRPDRAVYLLDRLSA